MVKKKQKLSAGGVSALLWKEDELFVAKAIEVEVVSQGSTKEEAIANLKEALDLYFE